MKNIKLYEDYTVEAEANAEAISPEKIKEVASKAWPGIEASLKNISPCKVIKMQDGEVSLNWGLYEGPKGKGGFFISKNGSTSFSTGDKTIFDSVIKYMKEKGMEIPEFSGLNKQANLYTIMPGPGYIWKYDPKAIIDFVRFVTSKIIIK
jgi:hypothetical protein